MEKKLVKLMLFEIIYNKLNLQDVEEKIKTANIKPKKINTYQNIPYIATYFTLNNDVNFNVLNADEISILNDLYTKYTSGKMNIKYTLYTFLEQNMTRLLFPKTDEKYLYWGPVSFEFMAPADAIVLGFNYLEFSDETELTDEQKSLIVDELNLIQNNAFEKLNCKVAVIMYNESISRKSKH